MIQLIAFILTFSALVILLKTNLANFGLDTPNHRSLHTKAIPRTGGLGLMLGVLASLCLLGMLLWAALLLLLLLVSLLDDIFNLSAHWRLVAQLLVAAIFMWFFMTQPSWWMIFLAMFAMVWMTNLYNFMDGSDGLAGGMGVFGFAAYALASLWAGDAQLASLCMCVSASCLAFLCFNFYPAKIFMGDAGSIPLGFLAGAVGLLGWQQGNWSLWFPVLIFSPFVVDATVTLIKRSMRGEKVWQAHRNHYYQRLVQMGWGHKKTALVEYVLMALAATTALLMQHLSLFWVWALLIFWSIAYSLGIALIEKRWKQFLAKR